MNNELMKKAYEDHNGVWPYGDNEVMSVRIKSGWGKIYSNGNKERLNNTDWRTVGTKADFYTYDESLKKWQKDYSLKNPTYEWNETRPCLTPKDIRELSVKSEGLSGDMDELGKAIEAEHNKINWSEAPEGATHYSLANDENFFGWWRIEGGNTFCICEEGDVFAWEIGRFDDTIELLPIPKEKPWVPEVGVECEATFGTKKNWYKFVIAGDFGFILIGDYWQRKLVSEYENIEFRPIKTERDQLIEIIDWCKISSGTLADVILEAGYRKK